MKKGRLLTVAALGALALLLAGCGRTETLHINDRGVITTLEARLPMTAGELLEEAEITLRPGDRLSPAPETVLRQAQPITVLRENVVQLTVDGRTVTVIMHGGTVGELLEREGVELTEGRHLNHDVAAYLTDGMDVRVSEGMSVWLVCDGERRLRDVEAATVGEALAECAVPLGEDDRLTPPSGTPLTPGMEIRVERVVYELVEQEESIPFDTRYERDETLPAGEERVVSAGKDGLKKVRYRVCLVDGVESGRQAVGEELLREPTVALIRRGPKDLTQVSVVSKKAYYDCDGSGHGYYEIVYSDGSVEYEYF